MSFFLRKKPAQQPAGQVTVTTTPSEALAQLGQKEPGQAGQYDQYAHLPLDLLNFDLTFC
jgi:hypothetical protein